MFGGEHGSGSSSRDAIEGHHTGSKAVPLTLRGFSLDVLDSVKQGGNADQSVEAAVRRYLADGTLRPPGWRCLPLPDVSHEGGDAPALEVNLGGAMFEELSAEATAQEVSLDALVSHAVMYAWAAQRTLAPGPAPLAPSARRRATDHARSDHRSRT